VLAATLTFSAEQNRVKLATHIEFPAILRLNQRCAACLQRIHMSRDACCSRYIHVGGGGDGDGE
jgi:hypothetical protein